MTFNQFLRIIRARWLLVIAILVVSVVSTLIVSWIIPKSYTASATVMADVRPDPVSPYAVAGTMASTYLATQVDIIKSPSVAQRVVRTLKLTDNEETRTRWQKATNGAGDYTAWLAELIAKGLTVKPSRESNVIEIIYDGASPAFASTLANAFARAYIESTVQIKVDPARQYSDFFEERARIARDKLERARSRLAEAQKEKGIVVTDERLDVETARLTELSTQVNTLRAMRAETTSRSAQASTNPDQLHDVLNSAVVGGLKTDLARQEARVQELNERYGDAHPSVMEAKANVQTLREKIRAETARVTGSVRGDSSMTKSREAEALAAFEAQRQRLLHLKEVRTDLQVMEREVDSAQRVYDSIQERLSQTNLESNTSQSGIYLLSTATEPTVATSPRTLLNVVVAAVLGTLLALMVALTVELFDRRVRSPLDIPQAFDMPVIGVLPAPKALKTSRKRLSQIRAALPLSKRNSTAEVA
jgi:succinoglycan biosynthesis transport protein ExoP